MDKNYMFRQKKQKFAILLTTTSKYRLLVEKKSIAEDSLASVQKWIMLVSAMR